MRIPLFAFLICSCFFTVHAQTYFSKVVIGPELDSLDRTILTSQGDLVTVGSYRADPFSAKKDIYVQKMSGTGSLQWTFAYDGGNWERAHDVAELPDGNLIIAGFSDSLSGPRKGLLMKIDQNGNLLWSKTYLNPSNQTVWSRFSKVIVTSDSALLVTGAHSTYNSSEIILLKTDLNGNVLWENHTDVFVGVWPVDLVEANPGEYSLCAQLDGWTSTASLVISYDDMGNVLSKIDLRDIDSQVDVYGMTATDNGEKVIAGSFDGNPYLARIDANDSLLWLKHYPILGDEFRGVVALDNGNFAAYNEHTLRGIGGHGILQIDSAGNTVSYYWVDSDEHIMDKSICVGPDGSLYLGAELREFAPTGKRETLIIRTSLTGEGTCQVSSLNIPAANFGYYGTRFFMLNYTTPEVNNLPMTLLIPQVNIGNLCSSVGQEEADGEWAGIKVSPNPTSGWINLSLSRPYTKGAVDIDLYDGQGRKLQQLSMRKGMVDQRIDLSEYVSGVYWLRVSHKGELLAVEKVVR